MLWTFAAEGILIFYVIFRENKAWHFMSVVRWADDSLKMPNLFFSMKNGEKTLECHLLQFCFALGGLMVLKCLIVLTVNAFTANVWVTRFIST